MTTQLTTFNFKSLTVRVVEIEGEPWFVASDVIKALGLYASEYRRLDDNEKSLLRRAHLGLREGRPMVIVAESGLYKLIMRSDKPGAKAFQDWVTKEVLPSIRKTGSYSVKKEVQPAVRKPITTNESETIKLMAQTIDRLTALQANPLITVEVDPLITFQQYEANTHQYVEGPTRQHILDTTVGLAKHRGIDLAR
ncbi:hypothetical protein HPA02_03000 [Bisbaumannia pacifica]|uniref:Bro-N domain-containing protein n=1 Tax=Bisbaumannia pacifica TaxID=77098 RepID=A0A510X5I1_9GAMM|nr:Bro-N domain-containing protein [Halomonas pacifica]GEK46017.1 hypothetical protein HPA02_03000 [Halomonas pacifica]